MELVILARILESKITKMRQKHVKKFEIRETIKSTEEVQTKDEKVQAKNTQIKE
jgi:hypothetical protein